MEPAFFPENAEGGTAMQGDTPGQAFQRALEAVPDAVLIADAHGYIIFVNQQTEVLFGYSHAELLGQPMEILLPERFRERHVAHRAGYMGAPRVRPMGAGLDLRALRQDGTEFPVEISLSPVELGKEVGVVSTIRDITERKQAEAERARLLMRLEAIHRVTDAALSHLNVEDVLRELLHRLASALAVDTVAILLLSDGGDMLEARAALGLEEEVERGLRIPLGAGFAGRIAAERRPVIIDDLDQAEVVNPLLHEKGIRSLLGVPLLVDRRLLGVLHVGTLQRHAFTAEEAALLQLVADRAALAIDHARLYAEAQAAIRMRNEFLSAISHDLGNPIVAIRMHSRQLQQDLLERQRRGRRMIESTRQLAEGLAQIQSSATRLWDQVEELLDLARLQVGRALELQWHIVDLVALVQEQIAAQQSTAPRHRLRLETQLDTLIGEWDANRLIRVVDNLLSNAVKYSPAGGDVVVRLRHESRQVEELAWAVIEVADRGMGIPASDMPRIFDRFYRGSNVVGRFTGTGIGLAGAKQIVEQHGGSLEIVSEEGRGTTVTLRLPLEEPL